MGELLVCHLGLVQYEDALALQLALREAHLRGEVGDALLLLEHPPVVTRGRRSDASELGIGEDALRAHGVDVVTTQRGGLATYHGPGMLVGYPIVAVTDVHAYLRTLERAVAAALREEGVAAHPRPSTADENLTGVWVDEYRKIASIGVHVSRGVAIHGFAVGADNDLEPWSWFTACGLPSVRMTSVAAETGRTGTLPCLRKRAAAHVARELGLRSRLVSRDRLERLAGLGPAPAPAPTA